MDQFKNSLFRLSKIHILKISFITLLSMMSWKIDNNYAIIIINYYYLAWNCTTICYAAIGNRLFLPTLHSILCLTNSCLECHPALFDSSHSSNRRGDESALKLKDWKIVSFPSTASVITCTSDMVRNPESNNNPTKVPHETDL